VITITILSLKNALLSSIVDTKYVFTKVNELLIERGKSPLFKIQLAGLTKELKLNDGLFSIHPDIILAEVKQHDLIIIPSLTGNLMTTTHLNHEFGGWISKQYKNGVEVASMCTGAFLLAFSGILKGKQCTTHWQYANEFSFHYPSVKLVDELMITDQKGIYSSGGSNAYWNLLMHLVEKFTNREIAIQASKYFVVDLDKDFQSPFIVFNGLKDHQDEVVLKSQEYIEKNYVRKFTIDEISDKFNVTRRTLERRFRKNTRYTINEYIQRVKVEAAKKYLEIGRKSISEIMADVGYNDIQAFRKVFKEISGMTPIDYKNKFQ
jgi:transcriptional regulator GlxA family with amidase domain